MATPDHTLFRQALRSAIEDVRNEVPRAWQNRDFTPPNPPSLWMRETYLPAEDKPKTTDCVESAGIWQLDVFDAVGNGTETLEALAKEVAAAFPLGSLSYGGINLAIDRVPQQQMRTQGAWCSVAVLVYWRSYTYH